MPKQRDVWVVRDVPEHTRRQVKLYAVEHDMTMARAIEVIVESVHRRHDRQLLDTLLNMYRSVKADDMESAKAEAEKVRELLTSRRRQWRTNLPEDDDDGTPPDENSTSSTEGHSYSAG